MKLRYRMLFSIVTVSAFDHTRLEKTFSSLLNLRGNVEYVVVIPQYDLQSARLFEKYQSRFSFPSRLTFDSGSGVYRAMNLGLTTASGKYVIFWNSGDTLLDSATFDNLVQECLATDAKWIIFGASFDWMPSPPLGVLTHKRFVDQTDGAYISHQQIAVNRNYFLSHGGFDSKFRIAADFKCIEFFSNFEPKICSSMTIVEVQYPLLSASSNRRGRIETFLILLLKFPPNFRAIWNISKREFRSVQQKINY